jgi:hypothetical protein
MLGREDRETMAYENKPAVTRQSTTVRLGPQTSLALRLAFLALALLPAIVPLSMILRYGVDMPIWDQWDPDVAGFLIKAHEHTLRLADLAAQHNEHRIMMPRIAWLILDSLTHWNVMGELILGWVIACGSSAGILWLICGTQRRLEKMQPAAPKRRIILGTRVMILWLLSNLFIFAPGQWENWLWGISAANFMPPFFVILALIAAFSALNPWPKTLLAIVLSAAATYSSGNGMLAWPLCTPLLAFPFSRVVFEKLKWPLATWLAAGVLFVGLYFVGYHRPYHGGTHPYATGVLPVLAYVPAFVGAPFSASLPIEPLLVARVGGGVMVAMYFGAFFYFGYRFWKRDAPETCRSGLLWLMVGGFVLMSGAEAGIGRAALTSDQAISSRYISFSLYMPLALAVMTALIAADLRHRRLSPSLERWVNGLPIALALLLVTVIFLGFPAAEDAARSILLIRQQAKAGLLLMNGLPENPVLTKVILSNFKTESTYPAILSRMGYLHPPLIASRCAADFRETDSAKMDGAAGRIESVERSGPEHWTAAGWAVSKKKLSPADAVFITYNDQNARPMVLALARLSLPREDVNNVLRGDFGPCGWQADLPTSSFPAHLAATSIAAWALDVSTGKAFMLDGAIFLSLAPNSAP